MFTTNQKPVTLMGRSPAASREGATLHLDQIDDALKQYASDPAVAAVLSAAESIRAAAVFLDASTAKVDEILKKNADAIETASDVARAGTPLHGFNSPTDREAVIATAGETLAAAFYRKAVAEVVTARQAKADKLCDDCVVSIEAAKLRIAVAHAKLALPLTMRMKIDADTKAQLDQIAIELAHDKPSSVEQLVKTFKAVDDEERATMILMAMTPRILDYLSKPEALARFRVSGNTEIEAAAAGRLKQLIENARRAEIPQSLNEAEAGYARLFPIFGTIFGRRVTPEDLRAVPNWLELALGKAPSTTSAAGR